MNNKFYRILDNIELAGRWWLKSPRDANGTSIEPELFCNGILLDLRSPLTISVRYEGNPLDWTFADFEMPVLTKRTANLLRINCQDDIQCFDGTVEGHPGEFAILNIFKTIRCLDERQSDILFWNKEDTRPEKIGQYRQVTNIKIDYSKIEDVNIFRITGWEIAIIVSERIKTELCKERITGIRFIEV